MKFQDILSLAQKSMYFTPSYTNKFKNVLSYNYGPAGSLFMENIKWEWKCANVIKRDISMSLFIEDGLNNKNTNDIYINIKNMHNKQLPFGIATICKKQDEETNESSSVCNYFDPLNKTQLLSEIFINPPDGNHYFMHWQRHRKLWWKKISHSPSRFTLGEIFRKDDGSANVNIMANFPWGNEVLETISISQYKENDKIDYSANFGRKTVFPMIIRNVMNLETALIGLFSDAFDGNEENERHVLRIHRKLSPYKCIISEVISKDEISMLAFNLTKRLRKSEIPTMLLPNSSNINLQTQLQRNDEWGIPYTILLDSASLKTGIVNIRDRDTTLNEEVHISEVSNYMKQLIKNF